VDLKDRICVECLNNRPPPGLLLGRLSKWGRQPTFCIELEDRLGAFWAEGALAAEDCEVLREGYIEWLGHKMEAFWDEEPAEPSEGKIRAALRDFMAAGGLQEAFANDHTGEPWMQLGAPFKLPFWLRITNLPDMVTAVGARAAISGMHSSVLASGKSGLTGVWTLDKKEYNSELHNEFLLGLNYGSIDRQTILEAYQQLQYMVVDCHDTSFKVGFCTRLASFLCEMYTDGRNFPAAMPMEMQASTRVQKLETQLDRCTQLGFVSGGGDWMPDGTKVKQTWKGVGAGCATFLIKFELEVADRADKFSFELNFLRQR